MVAATPRNEPSGDEKRPAEIVYPDSDGEPIADNTKQFRWIVTLKENLDARLPDFVAGAHLWYPVEGRPDIRIGPDVMVCPGRPKGDRGSYRQWVEAGVPPKVVFEVLSPGNTLREMVRKGAFYTQYGVDEIIFVDPESHNGWARVRGPSGVVDEVDTIVGWTSPFLGIRFAQEDGELVVYGPEGARFLTWAEHAAQSRIAVERAEAEAQRAEAEAQRAEAEAQRAEAEAQRAEAEAQRAARLAERLRALGVDPEDL